MSLKHEDEIEIFKQLRYITNIQKNDNKAIQMIEFLSQNTFIIDQMT